MVSTLLRKEQGGNLATQSGSNTEMKKNLPDPAMETGMAVQTGIAMINEENLEIASGQSNDDFTIPNPSQSYPDDLDLPETL